MEKESISLNKFISSTGVCSRREADRWIEAGRVTINGNVAQKGNRVFDGDKVHIDGKPIGNQSKKLYLKYYKPLGVTCTTNLSDPSNIIDRIGLKERIFPIGRLDKNSTGLILLTNDGDIVNHVLRKENKHEKEYVVRVDRPFDKTFIEKMSAPIPMLGTQTLPCRILPIGKDIFKIILTQGLNRQIRRMVEFCGYKVMMLKRIRVMHIELNTLQLDQWVYLTEEEEKLLLK